MKISLRIPDKHESRSITFAFALEKNANKENTGLMPEIVQELVQELVIDSVNPIDTDTKELVALPDKRAYRSMSRASVLMSATGLDLKEEVSIFTNDDPFKVGIYAALNNGPEDYECATSLLECSDQDFAMAYKKARSPKHYLKQLPNLAPAQLGIFLGIMGPVNTYTHQKFGSLHAIDQARFDLEHGKIDAALVCASFSLEDPLLCLRTLKNLSKEVILTEGSVSFLITRDDLDTLKQNQCFEPSHKPPEQGDAYFGVADQLIKTAQFLKNL